MAYQIIILAAGNGSRMSSNLPKVLHEVGGKPMIERVIDNAKSVTNDLILVHSLQLVQYLDNYKDICKFALQSTPLGTAHAVYSALDLIDPNKTNVVIYGDNPFISSAIIIELLKYLDSTKSSIVTLSFKRDDPSQYGRIVTDKFDNFIKIVEFKEANEEEKSINHCNSGIMAFAPTILKKYLPLMINGHRSDMDRELYLTKIIEVTKNTGEKVSYLLSSDDDIVIGVNTQDELLEANKISGRQSK